MPVLGCEHAFSRPRATTCSDLPCPAGRYRRLERGASPPAPGADMPGTPDPRGAIAIWALLFGVCCVGPCKPRCQCAWPGHRESMATARDHTTATGRVRSECNSCGQRVLMGTGRDTGYCMRTGYVGGIAMTWIIEHMLVHSLSRVDTGHPVRAYELHSPCSTALFLACNTFSLR